MRLHRFLAITRFEQATRARVSHKRYCTLTRTNVSCRRLVQSRLNLPIAKKKENRHGYSWSFCGRPLIKHDRSAWDKRKQRSGRESATFKDVTRIIRKFHAIMRSDNDASWKFTLLCVYYLSFCFVFKNNEILLSNFLLSVFFSFFFCKIMKIFQWLEKIFARASFSNETPFYQIVHFSSRIWILYTYKKILDGAKFNTLGLN